MPAGEFEKLKIYAYTDPACGDDQLAALDENPITAMINPENYTLETKIECENIYKSLNPPVNQFAYDPN